MSCLCDWSLNTNHLIEHCHEKTTKKMKEQLCYCIELTLVGLLIDRLASVVESDPICDDRSSLMYSFQRSLSTSSLYTLLTHSQVLRSLYGLDTFS